MHGFLVYGYFTQSGALKGFKRKRTFFSGGFPTSSVHRMIGALAAFWMWKAPRLQPGAM